jgi:hypothetical protein
VWKMASDCDYDFLMGNDLVKLSRRLVLLVLVKDGFVEIEDACSDYEEW